LHEFYCTALGIVATVVSLINGLGGAFHYGKSMTSLFCSIANVVKFASKRFQYFSNNVDYSFEN